LGVLELHESEHNVRNSNPMWIASHGLI